MKFLFLLIFILIVSNLYSQETNSDIKKMNWKNDYDLHIELGNDSNYVYNVKALYHYNSESYSKQEEVVYYPVSIDKDFINQLKEKEISLQNKDTTETESTKAETLWSAIHTSIGGGWVHFMNCVLYSLESNKLNLASPLMLRPESKWKPKPMTETFKRTKDWEYYVPYHQRRAIKEYKIRRKRGELADIEALPPSFVELFLGTSQKEYLKMMENVEDNSNSKIDLIRILLGANYLSQMQIDYIQSMVLLAVTSYSANQLPSVIIFDDLNAAVAMSLDKNGYRIDKIVFNDQEKMNELEIKSKELQIKVIVDNINDVNQKVFEEKLKSYYN
jgi:hypothetical protein